MTRVPLLVAFLVGTLFGGAASWWPREQPSAPQRVAVAVRSAGVPAGWNGVVLDAGRRDGGEPAGQRPALRNLFAFVEPPPAPQPEKVPVLETRALPKPVAPTPPAFPYRYVGNFGPPAMTFAVFVGQGEVINARVGDVLAQQFTLRRIGLESVDVDLAGWGEVRVPLTAR